MDNYFPGPSTFIVRTFHDPVVRARKVVKKNQYLTAPTERKVARPCIQGPVIIWQPGWDDQSPRQEIDPMK